jgi:Flp pilus assembly protein TadG
MRRFWSNEKGSLVVTFALALIPVMALMGAAVDYSRASLARTKMQGALDATALFLSKMPAGYTIDQLVEKATPFFFANYTETEVLDILISVNSITSGKLNISAAGTYTPLMVNLVGVTSFPVAANTEVKWGNSRLRVALVLDTTGSMSSAGKIDALRTSATNLIGQLSAVSTAPEDVYISIIPFVKDVNIGMIGSFDSAIASTYSNWLDFTCWTQEPPYLRGSTLANCPFSGTLGNWIASNTGTTGSPGTWRKAVPGASCPFTTGSFGFQCYDRPRTVSAAATTTSIPYSVSGTTKSTYFGLICTGASTGDTGQRFSYMAGIHYNGCYTTVMDTVNTWTVATGSSASCGNIPTATLSGDTKPWCKCTGSGGSKVCTAQQATHVWRGSTVAAPASTATLANGGWNGCITDRDQSYDVLNTAPATATPATMFKAEQYHYCSPTLSTGVMPLMGLSNNWTALKAKIASLQPDGNTNQGIGIALGWQSLTAQPFTVPTLAANYTYKQIVILMSDGLNTQNRYATTTSAIDTREATTCANAKATGAIIYSIQVNTGGDPTSTVLQNCATDSSKFFMLTSASQMVTTFEQIGTELANLHLSQ